LAGDLLPQRTLDQQIASGFERCGVSTNEAGSIVEEIEAMYAKDAWTPPRQCFSALPSAAPPATINKFDPIAQRDFYSMAAFFRNTTQNAMDGNAPDPPPVLVVPRDDERRTLEPAQD